MHLLNSIFLIIMLGLLVPAEPAVTGKEQDNLAVLEPLTGGIWVGEFDLPSGDKLRQERIYEWSFDKRLIVGKTFRITERGKRQTRQVLFTWNSESNRIEFWDFIDTGGYGNGIVKKIGQDSLYMEAQIIGSNHVDWRATFIFSGTSRFVSEVEIPANHTWKDAGTFEFRKK